MSWRGRLVTELKRIKELTIKENGVMYIPTEDPYIGFGLIKGDYGTPYANGFYLIKFQIPPEYPFKPPECWHLSMSGARQSPNFHDYCIDVAVDDPLFFRSGKVCLSRLNTWDGSAPGKDQWTPAMNITGVLNMIRMQVLTANALDNEPDYRHSVENPTNASNYEKFVQFHNFRSNTVDIYRKLCTRDCAVPAQIQGKFACVIYNYVLDNIVWYIQTLNDLHLQENGQCVSCDTYNNSSCLCDYESVLRDFNDVFQT